MAVMSPKYGRSEAKAAAKELIRGIFPAPPIPVDERGEIDVAGLRHDLRYCLDVLKVSGLYMNGYYGHFWLLSSAQRRTVIEVAVEEAAGMVPVINRCAHPSPHEAIELAKHSQDLGVDFISLVIPQFGGAHEDIFFGYFEMIASEIELGISVFNTDQAGYRVTPEMMARLAEIPNICALKNGTGLENTTEIRKLVGDAIVVIDPEEENFKVNMLEHGQRALYTASNLMMDCASWTPMHDYMQAALDDDLGLASRIYDEMQPRRDLHHKWILEPWWSMGVCPVSNVKFWTQQLGMTGGPVPKPLPDLLSAEDKEQLRAEMAEVGLLN